MDGVRLAKKFIALPFASKSLALEAASELVRVHLLMRWRPYRSWAHYLENGNSSPLTIGDKELRESNRVCQAIDVAASLTGNRATCLVKAIAGRRMLARRRIEGAIKVGVNFRDVSNGAPRLAHAWLDVAGRTMLGAHEKQRYAVIIGNPERPVSSRSEL